MCNFYFPDSIRFTYPLRIRIQILTFEEQKLGTYLKVKWQKNAHPNAIVVVELIFQPPTHVQKSTALDP
jgi:hypothetical protein